MICLNTCNKQKTIQKKFQWWSWLLVAFVRQLAIGRGPLTPLGQLSWLQVNCFLNKFTHYCHTLSHIWMRLGIWGGNSRQSWEWARTVVFLSFLSEETFNNIWFGSFQTWFCHLEMQTKSILDLICLKYMQEINQKNSWHIKVNVKQPEDVLASEDLTFPFVNLWFWGRTLTLTINQWNKNL